jgi:arginyl-tRNA synthetase
MTLKESMLAEIRDILAKYKGEWPEQEIEDTAKKLCVGAIKYGMLQADPAREIVFALKDWLSFEGNTGPYLMYGYSRANSVLKKALELGLKPLSDSDFTHNGWTLSEPSESELLRAVYDFNGVVEESCQLNKPSHLTTHLYYMCKTFSRFYAEVPVLKSTDQAMLRQRLTLIDCYRKTLKQGLALLGIVPPERM